MKLIEQQSKLQNNENDDIESKIIQLSIEYNILTNYTAIIGERKEQKKKLIE